ncbi:hypothetical protein CJ469_03195 [Nocardia farcinica]|nr:hypothetical protein [Nocardia farcinica]PFX01880.1 hypothetical protein CJ469_03195 [Nocardia farcinica]PFX08887.1 hypothetical protein CJ468_02134 [Nocardia farcinica]
MATRSVPQPPFSAELLADLHADNIDPELGAQLRPVVRADASASRYLHDLDEVSARVRALGTDDRIIHPMPADVAERLAAFVDALDSGAESAASNGAPTNANGWGPTHSESPMPRIPDAEAVGAGDFGDVPFGATGFPAPVDPADAPGTVTPIRPRRRGALRWAAAAAAAVAILAGAGIGLRLTSVTEGPPVAQPTSTARIGDELTATAALAALGRHDVTGPLANDAALDRCVQAAGLDRPVLGAMNMTYRGDNAVLILLSGPATPKITALVVGPGCTTGDPQVRNITDIG